MVANDPKQLSTRIKQKINGIKRGKRFLDYWQADALGNEIHTLLETIKTSLIPRDANIAAGCCEALLSVESTIFERADDSSGGLGGALRTAVYVWGDAVAQTCVDSPKQLAQQVYDKWFTTRGRYGIFDDIILAFAKALGKEGLISLEELFLANNPTEPYDKLAYMHMRKDIADAQRDVDKYITLCEEEGYLDRTPTIFDIAKRLITAARGDEALKWLSRYTPPTSKKDVASLSTHDYSKYVDLSIEAYLLEGLDKDAQKIRWQAFETLLSPKYYDDYLRYVATDEKTAIKAKAITLAEQSQSLGRAMQLLEALHEYEALAHFILKHYDQLHQLDYRAARNVSKSLAASDYPLAAVLLRRALAEEVLTKAISKYYRYAVNDLKLARDYSQAIGDWKDFPDEIAYLEALKQEHFRKKSFWPAYFERMGTT